MVVILSPEGELASLVPDKEKLEILEQIAPVEPHLLYCTSSAWAYYLHTFTRIVIRRSQVRPMGEM